MVVTDGITSQYKHYCEQLSIKPNSQVLAQLPAEAAAGTFQEWDLSGNCVGSKGATVVLKLVQNNFHALQKISLRGNNLASAVTQDIYNALVRHPSIRSVDLSDNDIRLGGPALVDLVKRNRNIVEMNIEQTFLRPLFERLIALHLKRNQEAAAAGGGAASNNNNNNNNNSNNISAGGGAANNSAAAAAAAATTSAATAADVVDEPESFAVGGGRRRGGGRGVQIAEEPEQQADATDGSGGSGRRRRQMFAEDPIEEAAGGGAASADGEGGGGFGGFAFGAMATDADHENVNPDEVDEDAERARATFHASFSDNTSYEGAKVKRRPTVASESLSEADIESFQPPVNQHEPEVRDFLFKALEKHDLFAHLEDFELNVLVDALEAYDPRQQGQTLYEEDEDECDSFFLIYRGRIEVSKGGVARRVVGPGETVLETMLMYPGVVEETGTVLEDDTLCYTLSRMTYRLVMIKSSKKKRQRYEGFLTALKWLQGLEREEILQLADSLKPATYQQGEKLITYGSRGENFFIITEGEVAVYGRDDAGNERYVCEFGEGACVGELEFIHNHDCVADVVAKTEQCRTAKMNRKHFEMVMGPVKDVLARTAAESEVYEYYRGTQRKRREQAEADGGAEGGGSSSNTPEPAVAGDGASA